jgi:hypothetical protein
MKNTSPYLLITALFLGGLAIWNVLKPNSKPFPLDPEIEKIIVTNTSKQWDTLQFLKANPSFIQPIIPVLRNDLINNFTDKLFQKLKTINNTVNTKIIIPYTNLKKYVETQFVLPNDYVRIDIVQPALADFTNANKDKNIKANADNVYLIFSQANSAIIGKAIRPIDLSEYADATDSITTAQLTNSINNFLTGNTKKYKTEFEKEKSSNTNRIYVQLSQLKALLLLIDAYNALPGNVNKKVNEVALNFGQVNFTYMDVAQKNRMNGYDQNFTIVWDFVARLSVTNAIIVQSADIVELCPNQCR